MIVHYHQMTGDELHNIYKLSGINQDELWVKLGLKSRSALINQFNKGSKAIDPDVEKKVKGLPELSQHRLLVVNKQNDVQETKTEGGEVVRFLTDTIQVLKDVIVKGEKQNETMQKLADGLITSNTHIREEAEHYRKMISDAYDSGLLSWKRK